MAPSGRMRGETEVEDRPILVFPELPGVRVVKFQGSTRCYSHYNETYSIGTLFATRSSVLFRGRVHSATPSDVVGLMEPDGIFRHVKIPVPETVGKLHIDPAVFERAARELDARHATRFKSFFHQSRALLHALSCFHDAAEAETTPLEKQSRFAECVRLIIELGTAGAPTPREMKSEHRAVSRARELLHDCFAERVTLDDLAEAAGLSSYYLVRIFTRDVGVPPHAYQNHLRLARARQCLAQGMPLRDTALEAGFVDQSHLIRHFRRTMGFTPGAYVRGS